MCIRTFTVTLPAVVSDIPALTLVGTVTLCTKGPLTIVLAHLHIFTVYHTSDYNSTPAAREKALVNVSLR